MQRCLYVVVVFTLLISSCRDLISEEDLPVEIEDQHTYTSDLFLPMHIGNYWRQDLGNYREITDTLTIDDELYYKFEYRVGYDVMGTEYLRLDNSGDLTEAFPDNPGFVVLHAKFNSPVGTKFFTLNDESINDREGTITVKNSKVLEIEFVNVFNANLSGSKHTVKYIRGLGFDGEWEEAKIDGIVYTFN